MIRVIKKVSFGVLLMVVFLLSSGCGGLLEDTGKVINNLTKPEKAPSTVDMMVYADGRVNNNLDNEPTPVNFVVIQMKNDLRLFSATFDEIVADLEAALKRDYISHEEYLVEPGKFTHVEPFELEKKTRYIAIVAAYRDSQQVIWRAAQKVKSENQQYSMHALFRANGIKLDVKE